MTDLGVFDFDAEGHARLRAVYPDISIDEVRANTGFALRLAEKVERVPLPDRETMPRTRLRGGGART